MKGSRLRDFSNWSEKKRTSPGCARLRGHTDDFMAHRRVGRALARRLADRAWVEDQSRVAIVIAHRQVTGSTVRRKVLALLCFLLTRPAMSSTRDQVLDALWPELDPVDALNSLNQTVYFLRRVLEEEYVDDLSPGYLHHDSDLIWLDPELVDKSKQRMPRTYQVASARYRHPIRCRALVGCIEDALRLTLSTRSGRRRTATGCTPPISRLSSERCASDLETGTSTAAFDWRGACWTSIQRRSMSRSRLLRLYRASGAHAAAAEQYAHYASAMREQLGIEPPPLDSL